jgi:hypothetical protein
MSQQARHNFRQYYLKILDKTEFSANIGQMAPAIFGQNNPSVTTSQTF